MALIKCPICGGTVSDKAPQCPHCNVRFTDIEINNIRQGRPESRYDTDIGQRPGVMYGPPYPEPESTPEPEPTPEPMPTPEPVPMPKPATRGRAVLYIVLALLFAAACGAGVYIFMDRKYKSGRDVSSDAGAGRIAAERQACEAADDSCVWSEDDDLGCETFDPVPEGAEHLYGNVYSISTDDLSGDTGWIKPFLGEDVRQAAVFADRIWLRSSMSADDDSNKLALLEYGTCLDVISQPSDKWTRVRVSSGSHISVCGYVSAEFIIDTDSFRIMDRHVTPDETRRRELSTAKWRRALTTVIDLIGWAYCTESMIVTRPYVLDSDPRHLMAFRIFDPVTQGAVVCLIEFYDGDEEYRLLGVLYDCDIRYVSPKNTGNYLVEMDFSRSLDLL